MTASTLPGRPIGRQGQLPAIVRRGRLLPATLALLVLLPVGMLFDRLYRSIDDNLTIAHRERTGVEYLLALGPVTVALNDVQAAAVAGRAVSRQPLTTALDAAGAVDQRVGDQLRTTERWTSLRGTIDKLPGSRNATDRYIAFSEASDLLLALYGVVRANSGLVRDPETDLYYLEDAAGKELPEAVVMAGRLADLSLLASSRPPSEQASTLAELATARNGLASSVGDLAVDLQRAVDTTTSTRLGDVLLSPLDRFRRSVDALGQATAVIDPRQLTVDATRANAARTDLEVAALDLYTTLLREMDEQIANRVHDLSWQRWRAVGATTAAVLLALALTAHAVLGRRRWISGVRRPAASVGTRGSRPGGQSPVGGSARYGEPVRQGEPAHGIGASHFAETAAGWQERSGAR
jgi:hypothetical protein